MAGTYPLTPDRVDNYTKTYSIIASDQGVNRKDVRRARNDDGNPRRSWTLTHSAISYADMSTLATFFIARRGKWDDFTFTDPATSTAYTVRFDSDTLQIEHPIWNRFSIQVRIIEVL